MRFDGTTIESRSEEETEAMGARLAAEDPAPRLILLEGELGAGKTTFVRGLARGLGLDPDDVSSPTFALLHEYAAADEERPRLRHLDLYRIGDLESIRDVGLLEILDEEIPVVVEWPPASLDARPGAVRVRIEAIGEGVRRIAVLRGNFPPGVDERSNRSYV